MTPLDEAEADVTRAAEKYNRHLASNPSDRATGARLRARLLGCMAKVTKLRSGKTP